MIKKVSSRSCCNCFLLVILSKNPTSAPGKNKKEPKRNPLIFSRSDSNHRGFQVSFMKRN